MQVLSGHLTQTNKVAINAILDANLSKGKVGRIEYHIQNDNGLYTVVFAKKDRGRGLIGNKLRTSVYQATFKF